MRRQELSNEDGKGEVWNLGISGRNIWVQVEGVEFSGKEVGLDEEFGNTNKALLIIFVA